MNYVHNHVNEIAAVAVIIVNAVLTRCPSIKENDIFHIIGTVFSKVFGSFTTKAE